ncbi:hypothetical protein QTP70_030264, partial [Hemibagrus guttatus]
MHAQRIHGHFQDSGDSWRMWQGIQAITNYKTTPSACDSDASLPDTLNDFYAWFEAQDNVAARKTIPPPNDQSQIGKSLSSTTTLSTGAPKFADDTTVVAENFTWSLNTTSITKKAQQYLYFLRSLRKAHLPPPILTMLNRGTIESILSSCITAWFGNCTVSDHKTLQQIMRTAEKIIGVSLPSITD